MAAIGNWQSATENIWQERNKSLIDEFKGVNSEIDKIKFVHDIKVIGDIPWLQFYLQSCDKLHLKSDDKSVQHRNHGNKLFQVKKYNEALAWYTKSIMVAPRNSQTLGLAYGNYSAASFYLEQYEETVEAIKLAIENQYPELTSYKLYLRWAQCLYHIGVMNQAVEKLSKAKNSVMGNKDIEEKKKGQLLEDIKHLEHKVESSRHQKANKGSDKEMPEVFQGRNQVITQASSAVTMMYAKEKGRFIQATSKIPAGSTVIAEKPYASVLLPGSYYLTHCHHCIGQLTTIVPCERCSQVLYCSDRCRKESWSVYHRIECQYLDICHSIGIAHLSLRIVLTAGLKYLLCFRDKMLKTEFYQNKSRIGGLTEDGTYDKTYLAVYDLMTHSDDIEIGDSFQYSLTALLLLTILKQSGWLDTDQADDTLTNQDTEDLSGFDFTQDDFYIGGLLLRHIEQLVCNAHAITELQITMTSDSSLVDSKSQERVAVAVYPTTSLLNHSCEPSIIAGFDRDLLVVRVIKDIEAGEEIYTCYGPHHKRMSKKERQQALKSQYFFNCHCQPCQKEEKYDIFSSYCCPVCREVLKLRDDMCSCTSCDYTSQSQKFIKEEKKCHETFVKGLECLQNQDVKGAIQKFRDCLNLQEKILYKHHKNLAETQDCLARCYAISEQYDKAVPYLRDSVDTLHQLYGDNSIEYANELHKFAGILYYTEDIQECLTVIDKAVQIFTLHFGEKYDLVQELENMKLSIVGKIKL